MIRVHVFAKEIVDIANIRNMLFESGQALTFDVRSGHPVVFGLRTCSVIGTLQDRFRFRNGFIDLFFASLSLEGISQLAKRIQNENKRGDMFEVLFAKDKWLRVSIVCNNASAMYVIFHSQT